MFRRKQKIVDEQLLWRNFKAGSIKDFELIYDQYFSILYGYGCHLCSDKDLVKDCIQSLFVYLWKNRESLSDVQSIKYYLYKSLRRSLFHELGRTHKINVTDLSEDYHHEVAFSYEFELISNQLDEEKKQKLKKSFETLTERQKEAIFLRFYENMEYEQIASLMALKEVKYARTLIYRAIEVLRCNIGKIYIF
jgi:RNA polymerase sigma factor (sigma-70 family)